MKKCIIVAVADNWGIGVKNALPWHISEDLQYFKAVTKGYPVIMGRSTYFSIGRPLPGRKNIVLNLGGDPIPEVTCVYSFDEAYAPSEDSVSEIYERLEPLLSKKEIMVLYYKAVFGYRWEEIVELTGIPSSTARLLYKQAKEKIRKESR